ncbi:MAG: InlB B-repeat-containing protein, partial [Oscillospiraceae bacterium]|nr:InlB B-repeat-containing protein [Oscillospiraceae bacterium]
AAAAAAPAETGGVKCRFDLDGGTLNGKTGIVTLWFGYGLKQPLPDAPVKDGAAFAGWQTEVNGKPVTYEAGEAILFTAPMDFVALWK